MVLYGLETKVVKEASLHAIGAQQRLAAAMADLATFSLSLAHPPQVLVGDYWTSYNHHASTFLGFPVVMHRISHYVTRREYGHYSICQASEQCSVSIISVAYSVLHRLLRGNR